MTIVESPSYRTPRALWAQSATKRRREEGMTGQDTVIRWDRRVSAAALKSSRQLLAVAVISFVKQFVDLVYDKAIPRIYPTFLGNSYYRNESQLSHATVVGMSSLVRNIKLSLILLLLAVL
mmetsp:Transcript_19342/g.36159  ORF Transcript_19342/g.36159 Transcript_19342/m.36159 type:complete len:121 (-) Transcript_19342:1877-2239(-)